MRTRLLTHSWFITGALCLSACSTQPNATSATTNEPEKAECPCTSDGKHDGAHPDSHAHTHTPQALEVSNHAARVIPHDGLASFTNNGNTLVGLATASSGANDFEVWRTSIAVGHQTPPHTHDSEETFVLLRGKGRVHVGETALDFQAPATVIAPANIIHYVENTGDEPTDAIVIVGVHSRITNAEGKEMQLPWRK